MQSGVSVIFQDDEPNNDEWIHPSLSFGCVHFNVWGNQEWFKIFIHYFDEFSLSKIAPEGMLRYTTSHLGLNCLPMSHKWDARII